MEECSDDVQNYLAKLQQLTPEQLDKVELFIGALVASNQGVGESINKLSLLGA
jgi:hypothetical protein